MDSNLHFLLSSCLLVFGEVPDFLPTMSPFKNAVNQNPIPISLLSLYNGNRHLLCFWRSYSFLPYKENTIDSTYY